MSLILNYSKILILFGHMYNGLRGEKKSQLPKKKTPKKEKILVKLIVEVYCVILLKWFLISAFRYVYLGIKFSFLYCWYIRYIIHISKQSLYCIFRPSFGFLFEAHVIKSEWITRQRLMDYWNRGCFSRWLDRKSCLKTCHISKNKRRTESTLNELEKRHQMVV